MSIQSMLADVADAARLAGKLFEIEEQISVASARLSYLKQHKHECEVALDKTRKELLSMPGKHRGQLREFLGPANCCTVLGDKDDDE